MLFDRACGTVAAQLQLDARVDDEREPPDSTETAREIASIFGAVCFGDPAAAASIVSTVLKGVGDERLNELADAIVEKLNAMPVAANARRNEGTDAATP